MVMYAFNHSVISKGKGQNAVAKSAYNSASKVKDYQEDSIKDYSNKSCDYSIILTQDHVPEEYKDREFLWNKVHETEKRKDSQLAREIILSLPNEFDREDNIELATEFAETLKDEGMIVDLNIHKLESNNPHSHLLCTLRGIDENGEFEPKRKGNEFIRDWNTKEKNIEWRKRWADIQNKHLEKHGFQERVSHLSYKEQGVDLEPTKTEGWLDRKYQKQTGNLSNTAKQNREIKRRNKEKIEGIYNVKKELNPYDYISKEQAKDLSSISKQLNVYLSPKTLIEKSNYIDDLSTKSLLISDKDKKNKQLDKVEKESELVDSAKEIFTAQSEHFFNENYKGNDFDLSIDDKIYLTHYMIDNNVILDPNDFSNIINKKVEEEQLNSLQTILDGRDVTHENIEKEKDFFMNKLEIILEKNNISMDEVENYDENDYKDNDFNKVLYYSSKLDKLAMADNILEQYYDNKISNLFGNDVENINAFKEITSAEEKKDIVDFIDFYGEEKTLNVINNDEYSFRFNENERKEIIHNSNLVTEKMNSKFPTDRDNYIVNTIRKNMSEKYNIDVTNSNDIKFVYKEALMNEDDNINQVINDNESKAEKYNYQYKPTNFSDIHRGINSIVYSMNEIFKERMNKYQNKQYKSKNHSKEKMQTRKKTRARGQGLT